MIWDTFDCHHMATLLLQPVHVFVSLISFFYNCKYRNIWNTLRRNTSSRQYYYPQQDKLLLGQITNSSIHDNNKYDTGLNLSLIEPNMYFAFINRNVRIFLFFFHFLDIYAFCIANISKFHIETFL